MGAVSFSIDPELVKALKQLLPLKYFVETGTFEGETIEQVRLLFEEVHSVELAEEYYFQAVERFKSNPEVHLYQGDSEAVLKSLHPRLKDEAVLYWLDAHWCVADKTAGHQSQCPLLQELNALQNLNSDSVVLIDDARLFLCPPPQPHEVSQWPSLDAVVKKLYALSSGHELMVLNDAILYYPAQIREQVQMYAHTVSIDWLSVLHKSHYYDTFLSNVQEKEAQIKRLADIAEERAVSLSQKEVEIQLLTKVAEERGASLLEKEAQIQLLAVEITKLRHLNQ
ncbi:MAG TPA: hypothetical protein V6D18_07460 [Thermosynechococcaceae cyanobacterium]